MNIAEFSIKKNVITLTLTLIMLYVGISSFNTMSRLEDPEFTIKQAVIATPYPGATAEEVEEEVTNQIEKAAQELGQLWFVESVSYPGKSIVKVTIKDKYTKKLLPQVWDELRRKVNDYQMELPPGAGPSIVNDDFGDVYGVHFAISGDGYSYKELKNVADLFKKELLLVNDVKKIVYLGDQPERIYIEMKREKMSQLGISQEEIYTALSDKNLVASAGNVEVGREYLTLNPTGEFKSENEFGDLLIVKQGIDKLVFLKDVANIRRGYIDPPNQLLRLNGKRAFGLGISTVSGGNVVNMGAGIEKRIKELLPQIPVGIDLDVIYLQSANVTKAIDAFMANLIAAVVIVVVVLLLFMGLQSGVIIGAVLFLTICGTFIVMKGQGVILERISLGALIIALGMLVDNAIVVVEGMKVKIESGEDAIKAAKDVVGQTGMPLLGATAVAIAAFAAIGVSQDSTGEFCRSLFQVIFISLSISWITAVTITPLFVKMFIKPKLPKKGEAEKDPYAGKLFQVYKKFLQFCLKQRLLTVIVVVSMFLASLFGFKFVKRSFFPASTTPQFLIDVYLPEGTSIKETERQLEESEKYLMSLEGVESVALTVGGGFLRFMLTYSAEMPSTSYGQYIVTVDDYNRIPAVIPMVEAKLSELHPEAIIGSKPFQLGPGEGGKIQLRIMGPDGSTLRKLASKAKRILEDDGGAKTIRDEWKDKVKVIRPQMSDVQAKRLGITRQQLAKTLEAAFSGTITGIYREGDDLIPIVARAPFEEREKVEDIQNLLVWSPIAGRMIPMGQVVSGFKTEYQDANIWRRDRKKMLRIHADAKTELPSVVLGRVKPLIEKELNVDVEQVLGKTFKEREDPFEGHTAATLPVSYRSQYPLKDMPGYSMGWDGELEDSTKGQAGILANLPIFLGLMVVIVICLFNALKQPAVIWLTVPLALIGVTFGLLICDGAFGFMALLGLLSLIGMLIKNAIVLIDQIDLEIREGKDSYQAIVDSGVSRLRPVAMAALTTILGMAPLLTDAFFKDMAITIMFGLGFATVLTLIFVPVLYSIFFRINARNI